MNKTKNRPARIADFPHYGDEFVVCRSPDGKLEVRCDAWPNPVDYVRVVRVGRPLKLSGRQEPETELVYWSSTEWQESSGDDPLSAMGAILGAIGEVYRGKWTGLSVGRKPWTGLEEIPTPKKRAR